MADLQDEIMRAKQEMAAVFRKIQDSKPGKHTFGLESQYGQAYQRLVRLGAAPQLRLKHRRK